MLNFHSEDIYNFVFYASNTFITYAEEDKTR